MPDTDPTPPPLDWRDDPDVISLDWREWPNLDDLGRLLARHGVTLTEVDTGCDQHAIRITAAETPEQSAAMVDANLRAMGSAGLTSRAAPVDHDAPELDAIEAAIRVAKTDVPELVAEVRRLRAEQDAPVEVLEDAMCRRVWAAALRWAAQPGVGADWLRTWADRIVSGELSPWEQDSPADPPGEAAAGPAAPDPHSAPAGTTLTVPDSPKAIRETLWVARGALLRELAPTDYDGAIWHSALLGRLITECDRHRPLGPNGKHGDRHTPTCGCPDKPADAVLTWLEAAASAAADVERMEGRRAQLAEPSGADPERGDPCQLPGAHGQPVCVRDLGSAPCGSCPSPTGRTHAPEVDARVRAEERAEAATAPLKAALAELRQRLRIVEQQAAELADDPAADGPLEDLLVCYRTGRRPSEALHRLLSSTRAELEGDRSG